MKKPVLLILSAALAMALCACSGTPKQQAYEHRYPGDYADRDYSKIEVYDAEKNDITAVAIDLWYAANEVYNVDDNVLFERGEAVQLFPAEPEYIELKNFDAVVDTIFTANGKRQVEQSHLSNGRNTFIQRQNATVYRMGPWRTGYSFAYALTDMQTKQAEPGKQVLSVQYEEYAPFEPDPDYIPVYAVVDFEITKTDGVWKVENYIFPEASFE